VTKGPYSASTVYLLYEGFSNLFFMMLATVASVYSIVEAGLDPLQLVLVGSVLEGTTLLFEVPTGVVADTVSRRKSIIAGTLLTGVAFILWGSFDRFGTILAAQVLWGIGYTFTSGADVAWITDEVGEDRARPLYLRAAQVGYAGALLGIVSSVALASISLWIPLIAAGGGYIGLGLLLVIVMPETEFQRVSVEGRRIPGSIMAIVKRGRASLKARPALILIFAIAVFHGASTEGFDRLWAFHLLDGFTFPSLGALEPIVWFGIINAVGLIASLIVTEVARRGRVSATAASAARALAAINALLVAAVVLFGVAENFALAIASLWVIDVLRNLNEPFYRAWINHGLDPTARATINSMGSQVDALGQILGGPALGAIGRSTGVAVAIVVSGVIRLPALLLFGRAIRRDELAVDYPQKTDLQVTSDES
jgi:MFS transporter, DHA3 family, tetracycline resistance protein